MGHEKVEIFEIFEIYPLQCGVKVLADEISVGEEVLGQNIKKMFRSSGSFEKAVKGQIVIVEFEDRIPQRTARRFRAIRQSQEEAEELELEKFLNLHRTTPPSSSSF